MPARLRRKREGGGRGENDTILTCARGHPVHIVRRMHHKRPTHVIHTPHRVHGMTLCTRECDRHTIGMGYGVGGRRGVISSNQTKKNNV